MNKTWTGITLKRENNKLFFDIMLVLWGYRKLVINMNIERKQIWPNEDEIIHSSLPTQV